MFDANLFQLTKILVCFLVQGNPVNTAANGPQTFGRINVVGSNFIA